MTDDDSDCGVEVIGRRRMPRSPWELLGTLKEGISEGKETVDKRND